MQAKIRCRWRSVNTSLFRANKNQARALAVAILHCSGRGDIKAPLLFSRPDFTINVADLAVRHDLGGGYIFLVHFAISVVRIKAHYIEGFDPYPIE